MINSTTSRHLLFIAHIAFFIIFIFVIKANAYEPEGFYPPPKEIVKTNKAFVDDNYTRHEYMIPMRDGISLSTIVYTPKDKGQTYPFLMMRTPYSALNYAFSPITASLGPTPEFDQEKFIFVFQDMRGKFGSQGEFKALRPFEVDKPSNDVTDEASDLYDSIDWLVKNIDGNNGRLGIWGISADGLNAVHGLMEPHPALKAVSPQGTPGDFYKGDDFLHNGAFHLNYIFGWLTSNARSKGAERYKYDTAWGYDFFRNLKIPLADLNKVLFDGKVKDWEDIVSHPTYDEFWQRNNVTQHLNDVKIPVLNVGGWFDVEDFWGSLEIYKQIERTSPSNNNTMIMGPWRHGGWYGWDGDYLANIPFGSKTSHFFREKFLFPFFAYHLKDKGNWSPAEFTAFDTGSHEWSEFESWPPKAATEAFSLYFGSDGTLSDKKPHDKGVDKFVSDPKNPVPFSMDIRTNMGAWWVMEDQRFASSRPDVLTYQTEILDEDIRLSGPVTVDMNISIEGTDADWIVKLIDVFPQNEDNVSGPNKDAMAGYQLIVTSEILRGRYREGLEKAIPFKKNKVTSIRFTLPDKLHTFKKGHKIMVQVQSSWFPMFDRNPQIFVENIFNIDPKDMVKSEHRVLRGGKNASRVVFPILK